MVVEAGGGAGRGREGSQAPCSVWEGERGTEMDGGGGHTALGMSTRSNGSSVEVHVTCVSPQLTPQTGHHIIFPLV